VTCQTELCRSPRIFEELVGASGFEPPTLGPEPFLGPSVSPRIVAQLNWRATTGERVPAGRERELVRLGSVA
jgi:hypothetical protein